MILGLVGATAAGVTPLVTASAAPAVPPSASRWAAVASGDGFTCGITRLDRVLWCTGVNDRGQLGTGDRANSLTWRPVDLSQAGASTQWNAVAAGPSHACAIAVDGGMFCWGDNVTTVWESRSHDAMVTLGLGSRYSAVPVVGVPTQVGTDRLWRKVSISDTTTCALSGDAAIFCWGSNEHGQAGVGHNDPNEDLPWTVAVPTRVGTDADYSSLSLGGEQGCALTHGGVRRCWGSSGGSAWRPSTNVSLGLGAAQPLVAMKGRFSITGLTGPVEAVDGGGWATLSLSAWYGCGKRSAPVAAIWCFGTNKVLRSDYPDYHHLGVPGDQPDPVQVPGTQGWASVATFGDAATCAMPATGAMKCWGALGAMAGNASDPSPVVYQPSSVPGFGFSSTYLPAHLDGCLVAAQLRLWCWGRNDRGQFGTGTTSDQYQLPVQVG